MVTLLAALVATAMLRPWSGRDPPLTVAANTVSELDDSGAVSASVPVGTNPVAVAKGGGAVWVTNASDDSVSKIDPATHAVQLVLEVGDDPRSLAVTRHDLWVSNFADGTVSRINLAANRVVDTVEVGGGPVALAAGRAGLWVANSSDNTIQRIDSTSGAPRSALDVGDGPDGLALDATSVWVANGRDGSVTRIDAGTGERMSAPIRVGSGPRGIVHAGHEVWVANELSQNVTKIDVGTRRTHTIDVGDGPTSVAVADSGVWVAEKYSGDLVRIDARTEETTRYDLGGDLRGLAVVDGRPWVTSGASASSGHHGGTVRVATGDLPGSFSGRDPAGVYDRDAAHAQRVVYDTLLTYSYTPAAPQVVVPDLATSVPEPTDSGRTYTFNLRAGIRYSTGRVVRASDLVRGVARALVSPRGRPDFYAGILGGQACIDHHDAPCDLSRGVVADDRARRVTFHLRAPDPQFLQKLTLLVVPAPAGTPPRTLTSPLPGTGPYRVDAATDGRHFVLSRNTYFREWSAAAAAGRIPRPHHLVHGGGRPGGGGRRATGPSRPGGAHAARRQWQGGRTSRGRPPRRDADPGAPDRRPRHRLRRPQLRQTTLRQAPRTASGQLRGRPHRGGAGPRRPVRGDRDLPDHAADHAVVRALLSLHAGPLRRQLPGPRSRQGPPPREGVRHVRHEGDGHRRGGRLLPPARGRTSPASCAGSVTGRASTGSRTRGATRSTSSTPAAASRSRPAAGSRTSRCPPTSTNYSRAGQADTRRGTATRAWTGERPGRPPCSSRIRAPPSAPGPGSTGR